MEKLEKEFLENGGKWREYSIEELFYSENGDFDIQNKHLTSHGELVISSGNTERGIIGRTNIKAKIINENCITVDMFGNVYARDFPFKIVTHARVFSLIPKEKMNIKVLNYISSNMFYLTKIHGYSSMATFDKIKGIKLTLPFLNGEINFSYMEKFIEELEAYLVATGLKDYHLTKYDENILDKFNELSETSLDRQE